jgi:hypothetical protein
MHLLSPVLRRPGVLPTETKGRRELTQHGGLYWLAGENGGGGHDLHCETQLLQLLIYYYMYTKQRHERNHTRKAGAALQIKGR